MITRTILFLSALLSAQLIFSQGCSDAGACSVESLNFDDGETKGHSRLKLNVEQTLGSGEKLIFISQTTAGIQYRILKATLLEMRIPFIYTNGNLGHTSGVGDLILSVNHRLASFGESNWSIIAGGRIKSNNADKSFNNSPLPMAYQTSLGTYDIILGSFYSIPKWDFYAAYQHPFGRNQNSYLVNNATLPDNLRYYESNKLKRGDDLYFRTRRFLELRNHNSFIINALLIYRLQEDEIYKNDLNIQLPGSKGLTFNIGLSYSKKLKNQRKLEYSLAFPIIDKNYRADGLTRNIVLGIRLTNL
ncbi:MAG: hypothetical protein GXO88_12220 [Chlorobi bacterium]|nr:hypothetical protein [Chlorobiota bacterium]